VHEASGLAVSRRHPDRLWAHNDSGEPVLFAVDEHGTTKGRVRPTGRFATGKTLRLRRARLDRVSTSRISATTTRAVASHIAGCRCRRIA